MTDTYKFSLGARLHLNPSKGCIDSLFLFEKERIAAPVPLFAVKLRNRKGEHHIVDAFGCRYCGKDGKGDLLYSSPEINVALSCRQDGDALLWGIDVRNHTNCLLEWVEIMSLGVNPKLVGDGGEGEILFPYNEGALIKSVHQRESSWLNYQEPDYPSFGSFCIFPNMLSSQYLLYLLPQGGIYFAFHDESRTIKHIDFHPIQNALKLQMRAYCDAGYGEDYHMPYPAVMRLFEGDAYTGLSLYRGWFHHHLPAGLRPIEGDASLPGWYLDSPVVVAYPVRGHHDTDEMRPNRLFPYPNALPYLQEIGERTDSPCMALLMHYEGTAPWAPPYLWPPYGGEAMLSSFVDEIHKEGNYIGLYASGFGYTLQSNLIPSYQKRDEFQAKGYASLMCSNTDGSLASVTCRAQRAGYDVCPATKEAKQLLDVELGKAALSGVDYLQALDQNHGGSAYFCYSGRHGHVPAPGRWTWEESRKAIASIPRKEGVLLGCESGASEPFLDVLKFNDDRFELNYMIGEPFPAYSFLYHPYVHNFMGNQVCCPFLPTPTSFLYRMAYAFAAGDMLTLVLQDDGSISQAWGTRNEPPVDKEDALALAKNLNGWRRGNGKPYLLYGEMVRPEAFDCETREFPCQDGHTFVADSILTAAYSYHGRTAQFLVNYDLVPQKVVLPPHQSSLLDPHGEEISPQHEIEIPAKSAICIFY